MELILKVQELKRKPNREKALELLLKLKRHVYKLMKSRGLKVLLLTEMYPSNKSLLGLNVNRGQAIRIRLRSPHDENQFLEWHDLIGTMLHELVHNLQGPHDVKFYKLLDDFFTEYEDTLTLDVDGHTLGINADNIKQKQLEQAEKRKWLNSITGTFKLGGNRVEKDLRKLAYEAAEKRRKDSLWCGDHDLEIVDLEGDSIESNVGSSSSTKEKKSLVKQIVIDLTDDCSNVNVQNDTPNVIAKEKPIDVIYID
ncbi:hypothetical protein HDV06_004509 [Boothiomyces sp. JEL0866]|nr:hypothetical protein HDV06_004509 [Boothiomyces sp. JEL0866]